MRQRNRTRGFSLLELMIVVMMALIIAGFAIPAFLQTLRNFRIMGDIRDINGEILLAKMRAAANFTWARVYFDFDNRRFVSQMWCKTENSLCDAGDIDTWKNVNVGGPQNLSTSVSFGFGAMTLDPNGDAIAQAPTCRTGTAGDPGGGGDEAGNSACIMFNSRGFPVDNAGTATAADAVYITDGAQIQGATVSITGLTRTFRADNYVPDVWTRH
jgi:prepilin-type N-terminal cleavage/methylation domain-containing protein